MDNGEFGSDETMLDSYTVTIALDTDDHKVYVHDPHLISGIADCEEPPRPESICPQLADRITIFDLTQHAFNLLSLFLNADAIGSMKNWEYLASQFGLSHLEISNMRKNSDPTERILERFAALPMNRLIEYLCEMERVDLLISLKPHLDGLSAGIDALDSTEHSFNDSGVLEAGPSTRMRRPKNGPGRSRPLTAPLSTPGQRNASIPDDKFIVVTHYEVSKRSKKLFKYFFDNLQHYGREQQVSILDINECIDESNIYQIEQFFTPAKYIILFATRDFADNVNGPNAETATNALLRATIHFTLLMNNEYSQNRYTNRRFRVVLPSQEPTNCLPLGWATNTLVYKFPENFNELCTKIFETTDKSNG